VPQADPKNRLLPYQITNRLVDVLRHRRISWTIRNENSVHFRRQNFVGFDLRGENHRLQSLRPKQPQNIALHPTINRRHPMPHRR
jgi:hypothetical protein